MPVDITAESVVPFEGMGHFKFKFLGKSDNLHEVDFIYLLLYLAEAYYFLIWI